MTMPMKLRLEMYQGTLILDNNLQQAFLQQRAADNSVIQTLMMLDSPPLGDYDPAEITAAWQYFSKKPGVRPGDTIIVYGFWNYPQDSTRPVLHVVRG